MFRLTCDGAVLTVGKCFDSVSMPGRIWRDGGWWTKWNKVDIEIAVEHFCNSTIRGWY